MRVLLSAYACEPDKGSEQEIGWQRALHMPAYADEVWVLTRANNQAVIDAHPSSRTRGLQFIYYDLPRWALKLKKQAWFLPIYVLLWQWGGYRVAARHHRNKRFDRVYHVTFSGMVSGSFMGRLGTPFIVGPIAGGERAPFALRHGMPMLCKLKELLRDLGIVLQRYSPLTCPALAAAERIYVVTPDSLRLVQKRWHYKTEVQLSVASCGQTVPQVERPPSALPRFVFAGRLIHWKGAHFAIRALAEARRTVPAATLTLLGSGPAEHWLRNVAKRFGVAEAVEFVGHAPRQRFVDSLRDYTAMIFPSLHDSGGFVVLEAFANGLPVVCLDLGGPGKMANSSCGIVISTANTDEAEVVTRLANAIVSMATMPPPESARLSRGAIARAKELSWSALTARIARR
jgi:glycosyltransferase involved in cell wall biosynthesis